MAIDEYGSNLTSKVAETEGIIIGMSPLEALYHYLRGTRHPSYNLKKGLEWAKEEQPGVDYNSVNYKLSKSGATIVSLALNAATLGTGQCVMLADRITRVIDKYLDKYLKPKREPNYQLKQV